VGNLGHVSTEASGGLIAAKPSIKGPSERDLILFRHARALGTKFIVGAIVYATVTVSFAAIGMNWSFWQTTETPERVSVIADTVPPVINIWPLVLDVYVYGDAPAATGAIGLSAESCEIRTAHWYQ
jgi:hypothetical protein